MPNRLRIGYPREVRIWGEGGSYALSGQNAGLQKNIPLVANSGSYAVSGQAAVLTYSPIGEVAPPTTTNTRYVRPGAIGANDGSDWDNAYTALPTTLQRDTRYYLAPGSYGTYTCNTAVSGTQWIVLVKATAADHGSDAGWTAAYGDGTADFTGLGFATSRWWVSGAVGGGPGSWDSGHGITVFSSSSILMTSSAGVSNIGVEHVKFYSDRGATFIAGFKNVAGFSFHTFRYCQFSDIFGPLFHIGDGKDSTVEYCYLARNKNTAADHSEMLSSIGTNERWVWRWNIYDQIEGTAVFAGVNTGSSDAFDIYGSIFARSVTPLRYYEEFGGGTNHQTLTNSKIYNNTIIACGPVSQGAFYADVGSGNTAYNNLFYSNDANQFAWDNIAHNYTYASNNIRSADGPFDKDAEIISGEANGQDGGSTNPFVSYTANPLLGNYQATTSAGLNTSALLPGNDEDMLGNARGSGGWRRGAIA